MVLAGEQKESRMERKKEAMKQKIVAVAMELFRTQGVHATTMEQIAEAADVAKGTLYNYFPVKEAIISAHIQQTFRSRNDESIARLRELPDTRARMRFILEMLFKGIQAQPEIFERYFTYQIQQMLSLSRANGMNSGMGELSREVIALGQKSGELRTDLPFPILKAFFDFVFVEVAQEFYADPAHFRAAETIDRCIDLFLNGAQSSIN